MTLRFARLVAVAVVVIAVPLGFSHQTSAAESKPLGVRIVNLNLLHGAFCAPDTNHCQAPDRVDLLVHQIEQSGCPEVIGLQEIDSTLNKLIKKSREKLCKGSYQLVFPHSGGIDSEQVLTTLPVVSTKVARLSGRFRTASRVVLKSALGPLVLVVTHQDGDPETATPGGGCKLCKPPCTVGTSLFQCQTDSAVDLAEKVGKKTDLRVLMGDFNVPPTSDRYRSIIAKGWVDSYLEAGNPECNSVSGVGCTSGRDDKSIAALKDPTARESERIDFIFVKPSSSCAVVFDPSGDTNQNKLGTGLFNPLPANGDQNSLVWTSDHTGVSVDISCAKK